MNQEKSTNPYDPPALENSDWKRKRRFAGVTVLAHFVATVGASLVFAGAFLAVFGIPTVLFEEIAANRLAVQGLAGLAILAGAICAFFSYRSTLRVYSQKEE